MQKLVTLALLGLVSTTGAYAQTPLNAGRGLLTGSINYHRDGFRGQDANSSFEFSPAAGYFVANNLVVGLNLGIQTGSSSQQGYTPTGLPYYTNINTRTFSVGPFARYYRFVGGDKFALFGQGGLGYIRARGDYGFSYITYSQGYASIAPGLAFFPIPRFGLEASLRGLSLATDFDGNSSLDLGVSLRDFQLGASYYFGK